MKEFMASTMEIKICFKLKKDIKQEFWQHFVVHDIDLNWNAYNFLFLEQKYIKYPRPIFFWAGELFHSLDDNMRLMIFNVDCNWLGRGILSVLSIVWHAMH